VRRFLFQTIHDVALMLDRERVGREASPTGGVIDSQSVKAPEAKTRGYDAGKNAVDDAGARAQAGQRFDDQREAAGEVIAGPAVEPHLRAVLAGNDAEAVVLNLMQPKLNHSAMAIGSIINSTE
jgi:glucose-6-phosphate dehydrogenase assembly protein OpcA